MLGLPLVIGNGRDLHEVTCQVGGTAWQMSSATFLRLLPECPQLQQTLQRYALALLNQTSRGDVSKRRSVVIMSRQSTSANACLARARQAADRGTPCYAVETNASQWSRKYWRFPGLRFGESPKPF